LSYYLDASALIPFVKSEDFSKSIEAWLAELEDPLVTSNLSIGEAHSSFSREVRMGQWDAAKAAATEAELLVWLAANAKICKILDEDIEMARRLVKQPMPKLLMPDGIHLATCKRLGLTLVTFDKDLAAIAAREGVACMVPA
jgi:uncharacterized protein